MRLESVIDDNSIRIINSHNDMQLNLMFTDLHQRATPKVSFREKMAKYISILQHSFGTRRTRW